MNIRFMFVMLIFTSLSSAQDSLQAPDPWKLFNRYIRGEVPQNLLRETLDSAITLFESQLGSNSNLTITTIGYMRSILLKVDLEPENENSNLQLLLKACSLGHNIVQKDTLNGEAIYWYIACLGSKAKIQGVMHSVQEGVADKVLILAERMTSLPDSTSKARGHRIMGHTHFKVPYIPFFLTWPSSKKAREHLEQSYLLDSTNLNTLISLAEFYYSVNEKELAITTLKKSVEVKIRPEFKILDEKKIKKSQNLLLKWQGDGSKD